MHKHRSLGEMISSATFFGCGIFIFLYSMELFDDGHIWRGYLGLLAAFFCGLGPFRFAIANLVERWRGS